MQWKACTSASSQASVWLAHAKVEATLLKAGAGPQGPMAWALQELRVHEQAEWQGAGLMVDGRPQVCTGHAPAPHQGLCDFG